MTAYFCHKCRARCESVNNISGEVKCSRCNDSFVEELPEIRENNDEMPTGSRATPRGPAMPMPVENPFLMFPESPFAQIFLPFLQGSRPQQPSTPPTPQPPPHNHPQMPANDPMVNMMQQIITGLISHAGGGHPVGGHGIAIRIVAPGGGGDSENGGPFGIHGNLNDYAWGPGGLDNVLTALLNQFAEGQQPVRTLSQEEIAHLPMIKVTEQHVINDTQCTTCMETFTLDEPAAELNCKHIFHRNCIVPWLTRSNTCPICRTEIDPTNWMGRGENENDTKTAATKSNTQIADFDDLD